MTPTTPKPSAPSVKAAEEILSHLESIGRFELSSDDSAETRDLAAIITRHFAPLAEVSEAAEELLTDWHFTENKPALDKLRAALEKAR